MKEVKRHLIIINFKISTETYLIKDMLKKHFLNTHNVIKYFAS